jgi:hypothetical protein
MVVVSGLGKIRRVPRIVHVIHEVIGVPLKYFSLLATCELPRRIEPVSRYLAAIDGSGGEHRPRPLFVGATVSPLRVSDVKGLAPAVFMLAVAAGALAMRF